jgi:hypothetical protein
MCLGRIYSSMEHEDSSLPVDADNKGSLPIWQTIQCHIPDYCNLNIHCHENLKSQFSHCWSNGEDVTY